MIAVNAFKNHKLLILVILSYAFLFLVIPSKALLAIKESNYYLVEMLQIMPVIFMLTVIIETWIPKKLIIKALGEKSGYKGIVFAFLLGSFSVGPIYAAFPIAKLLLNKGASILNIGIILSSWAVIKVPMLANEAKFLGIDFMGLRWSLTVTSILIISMLLNKIINKSEMPIEVNNNYKKNKGTKRLKIETTYCIGCGLCEKIEPGYFEIKNKKAKCKITQIEHSKRKDLDIVISRCPAKAIQYT